MITGKTTIFERIRRRKYLKLTSKYWKINDKLIVSPEFKEKHGIERVLFIHSNSFDKNHEGTISVQKVGWDNKLQGESFTMDKMNIVKNETLENRCNEKE